MLPLNPWTTWSKTSSSSSSYSSLSSYFGPHELGERYGIKESEFLIMECGANMNTIDHRNVFHLFIGLGLQWFRLKLLFFCSPAYKYTWRNSYNWEGTTDIKTRIGWFAPLYWDTWMLFINNKAPTCCRDERPPSHFVRAAGLDSGWFLFYLSPCTLLNCTSKIRF